MTNKRQVVVVGAGYAGVMATNRILAAGHEDIAVTVVNPRPDFVERIRLHQLAAGTSTALVPLNTLLHKGAHLRIEWVDRIGDGEVELSDGSTLPFDRLVYAVGSNSNTAAIPGAAEHALFVAQLHEARALKSRLAELPDGATVTVVGGGATGIELAAEIAEQVPRLRVTLLAAGDIAAGVSVRARRAIVRRLEKLGVDVEAGSAVTRIIDGGVVTADGRIRSSAATVVCCSFGVPELATRSGLPVDDAGRLLVDETLTALGRPDIVGVGDAIALPPEIGWYNRMSCQSASPLGAHGGGTVLAGLEGAAAEPVSFGFVGTNISLGRRSGVIQFAHLDDSPSSMILRGRSAATVKELVCRATLWGMKIQGRMKRPPLAMPAPRRRKDLVTA